MQHSSQSKQFKEGKVVMSIPFYAFDIICVGSAFIGATCGARSTLTMAV